MYDFDREDLTKMMEMNTKVSYDFPKTVEKTDGYRVPFALYKLERILDILGLTPVKGEILATLALRVANYDVHVN